MFQLLTRRDFVRMAGLTAGVAATSQLLLACMATTTDVLSTAAPTDVQPTSPPTKAADQQRALQVVFPKGFLWGVATSAYQIEGAANVDGRGESVWDRFSHTPGRVLNGDTGDVADDHYHRFEQDFDLMQQLGVQTYRFSIAWPRIVPTGAGAVNQQGIDFYKRLVEAMLKRDIQPMATLFHWDLPQALQDLGGWESRDTAQRFAEYADTVYRALGDQVKLWLTLNEPKTVVDVGYILGIHAPGVQDRTRAYTALHHMLLGHGLAVQAFRAANISDGKIGAAMNVSPVYPIDDTPAAQAAAVIQDGLENRLYLDPMIHGYYPADMLEHIGDLGLKAAIQPGDLATINQPLDILGINYYNPIYVAPGPQIAQAPHEYSAASWQPMYAQGMYDMLTRIKRDYGDLPLYITENGAPFDDELNADHQVDDQRRVRFLYDHFAAAQRAISDGVNLQGYYVWSFMDNFEWAEGYNQRWGIIYVDYATLERVPKQSALWYSEVIKNNGLGDPPAKR